MSDSLLSPSFLFCFAAPLQYCAELWPRSEALPPEYALPQFQALAGKPVFADLRGAWNEEGAAFSLRVEGKKSPPLRQEQRLEDSDGLQLWIDTRATRNVHRASRFCHRLLFLPAADDSPCVASALLIHRAKSAPKPPPARTLQATSQTFAGGYQLDVFIGAGALTGYDPEEHPRLGFFYAVQDRELQRQTWSIGSEFPYEEDPSVWGVLDLVREES